MGSLHSEPMVNSLWLSSWRTEDSLGLSIEGEVDAFLVPVPETLGDASLETVF